VSESPNDGANRKEGLPSEHESATFSAEADYSASANDLPDLRREEGVSFTKVSRGDGYFTQPTISIAPADLRVG
jgi:hypothetical protein